MDKYELQSRAKVLREAIESAQNIFVFDPNIKNYIQELNELEEKCEHEFLNGTCIWCGKKAVE